MKTTNARTKTAQESPEEVYIRLLKEHNLRVITKPILTQRDDGHWDIVVGLEISYAPSPGKTASKA